MIYNVRRLPNGRVRVIVSGRTRARVVDFSSPAAASAYVWYLRIRYRARAQM